MSIIVDLIIIAIILLSTFLAYRKGLITLKWYYDKWRRRSKPNSRNNPK